MKLARKIDPKAFKRVSSMGEEQIKSYLHDSAMSLSIALEGWHYHDAPQEEVRLALDALVALWSVMEQRNRS